MGYKIPDGFEVKPMTGWGPAKPIAAPAISNAAEKKKSFGVELGKGVQPFQAACNICGQDTQQALWIAANWLNDPEVIANKDLYLKGVQSSASLLDKEQLAARLLAMAEERNASGSFYILDGKDRLSALKLYAEVQGFVGKDKELGNTNFIHNQISVKFVEPDKKEIVVKELIDAVAEDVPKLKLVG